MRYAATLAFLASLCERCEGANWPAAPVAVAEPTSAANPDGGQSANSTLTILVHDYTGLPDRTLRDLQTLTAVVLSRTGLRLEWAICTGPRLGVRPALCDANLEPGRIILRILAHYSGSQNKHGDPLGSAEVAGGYGSLYMAEIRKAADHHGLSSGCVMAYAAAHEIGHLLLGPEHALWGIMQATWGRAEYRSMGQRSLAFRPVEADKMRGAVRLLGNWYLANLRP